MRSGTSMDLSDEIALLRVVELAVCHCFFAGELVLLILHETDFPPF
jgi:hypothetical protein